MKQFGFIALIVIAMSFPSCKKCYFCEEKISGIKEEFCEGSEGYESLKWGENPANWKAKSGISYSCAKK